MKILVLMGGTSAERDVSLASGEAIVQALKDAGHQVLALDAAQGQKLLSNDGKYLPGGVKQKPPDVAELERKSKQAALDAIYSFDFSEVDVVFLALHGGQGEDGTIQALLDLTGKPYTGSGVLARALAMDKAMSKKIFEREGILTPEWFLIVDPDLSNVSPIVERIDSSLSFPCVVKPNNQGSTVGLTVVNEKGDLKEAVECAQEYSTNILVERFIPGRELTVGVLGDTPLPVVEIIPEHGIYDYECKYTPGMTDEVFPADVADEVRDLLQTQALDAHRALGLRDFSRVDFKADADGVPQCLEVNTLPGLTATSLLPQSAAAVGISFGDLCETICSMVVARARIGNKNHP